MTLGNMPRERRGDLQVGDPVRVKGMGKCAQGRVTNGDADAITYRCLYHGGEHTVAPDRVRHDYKKARKLT